MAFRTTASLTGTWSSSGRGPVAASVTVGLLVGPAGALSGRPPVPSEMPATTATTEAAAATSGTGAQPTSPLRSRRTPKRSAALPPCHRVTGAVVQLVVQPPFEIGAHRSSSASRTRRDRKALARWLFTVPTVQPSTSAVSASVRSS